MKTRKEYDKEKSRIASSKRMTENEKTIAHFNNWQDYIFGSIPEETKRQNLAAHQNEMIFVRI